MKTPVFAIQSTVSVHQEQCISCGFMLPIGFLTCCDKAHAGRTIHWYFEYASKCDKLCVNNYVNPIQTMLLNNFINSGLKNIKGNGGFFHSCHLGA